jgi:hypothetical protein
MGSDSFEWSTDVVSVEGGRKTPLTMQDNRRLSACRQYIGVNDSQSRVANGCPQHYEATLVEWNPLHEDIVQAPVRLPPAIVGSTVQPGASIRDISSIDQGTPLIIERTCY